MSNYEVSDRCWEQAEPLLEPFKRRTPGGSKPLAFRQVMNGILYVLKSGCQWRLLPRGYGSKSAVHEHFQRWVAGGVFTALFRLGAET
jgi:transposase